MFSSLVGVVLGQSSLQLPALFAEHAVFQRGKPIAVWGWDRPGQKVSVSLNGKSATTVTRADGRFQVSLPKLKEGGPYALKVDGSASKTISDVYVGEVWICSGQSNMEWPMSLANDRAEAKTLTVPQIRMFNVTKKIAQEPQTDVAGNWLVASPDTLDTFSAVGYAFARKLYAELKVPIGMIHTSWGGTPAEAWTDSSLFASSPLLKPIADRMALSAATEKETIAKYQKAVANYQEKALPIFFDQSDTAWTKARFDDSAWESAPMPFVYPADFDGEYRHRVVVNLTAAEAKATTLSLGPIDDFDQTYVNGWRVGQTDMSTPNFWSASRVYKVPEGILKEGPNVIAVRSYDWMGAGGFMGAATDMKLGDRVLGGNWRHLKGATHVTISPTITGTQPQMPEGRNSPNYPSTLYNGMLKPLAPYSVRGAIWYQGESNAWRAVQYTSLLNTMIANWRRDFGQGEFPFYIAQLANYMAPSATQFDSAWAELRDSQDIVGQMKNCGTATIIDIGEAADIHPRNKKDVGERLARIALKKDYGKRIEWQGPRFKSLSTKGDEIMIEFTHASGLRTTDSKAPRCFAISDSSGKWKWAEARIEGNKVILKRSGAEVAVRYAWQDNPPVNLVNSDGLPAMPFRTDSFPLITAANR